MSRKKILSISIHYLSFLVWFVNGLVAKILNFVPRHQEIVERVVTIHYGREIIVLIGIGELLIALWVLSRWNTRLCVWSQIILVVTMNIVEFLMVPDLLLFGKLNILVAFIFCLLIYWNEYKLKYARIS